MNRARLLSGAALSSAQVVVGGAALFIYYRYVLNAVGPSALGIWSLVLASTSIGRVADLGIAGGVSRFVAQAIGRREAQSTVNYSETAVVFAGVAVGALSILIYPLVRLVLGAVVAADSVPTALSLLPFAFVSFWASTLTTVVQGAIDGTHRVDVRNLIMMGSALLQTALGILFVSRAGLVGLAYAQVAQAVIVASVSWSALRRCLPGLPFLPVRIDRGSLRDLVRYGWKLQIVGVAALLFEPTTKALLTRFGGLASTGYYDMATRMVQQIRAFVINANQVLVPAVADTHEIAPERGVRLYRESYELVWFAVPLMTGSLILLIPAISEVWIGHYEQRFVTFSTLVTLGWFLNILTGPGYFAAIGSGRVLWNVLGHVTIAVLNVACGIALGEIFDGVGVVVAAMISLLVGSSVVVLNFHREQGAAGGRLLPAGTGALFASSALGLIIGVPAFHYLRSGHGLLLSTAVALALWSASVSPLVASHRVPARLRAMLSELVALHGKEAGGG